MKGRCGGGNDLGIFEGRENMIKLKEKILLLKACKTQFFLYFNPFEAIID